MVLLVEAIWSTWRGVLVAGEEPNGNQERKEVRGGEEREGKDQE